MAFSAGAIVSTLSLNRAQFSAAMKQVTGQVNAFGGVIQKNSVQIKNMGRKMTVAGVAIIGTLGLMVKAYGSFNEAMVRSLAIMGDVSPAMRKEMAKTAKQLSTETTFAAKDLAEAYYFLASAGMNAEQSISALAPVARFAQAGTFDLALATDLLTDAQTALGLSSKNVIENEKNLIRVSDVLVGANTLANASVLQFAESLTNKAAAAIVNLNKEVEEGVAVLAAYADKGVKGRLAGQRLTMMLNGLFEAVRNNSKIWEAAGISLFNADESMRSIADIIQDLEGYLGSMTVKQREAALAALGFNIKTKDSILTLMGSSEKIREWTEDLKKMGGITKVVADKQLEAFNAKMTILKNTVIKAAIGIGESLTPTIEELAKKLEIGAAKTSIWIEKQPRLTAVIAKTALSVGALLLVLGPLVRMIPGLVVLLPALKVGFAALLGPLGVLIAGITAIAVGIGGLIKKYKELQDAEIDAIVKATSPMGKAMALRMKLIRDEIITTEEWSKIFNKHGRSYKRVLKAIATLPEYAHIKAAWDGVIEKHEEVEVSIKKVGTTATTVFPSWATTVGKIFHDTSVRAAEMQGVIERKIVIPPMAVNIPKMSLKDLRDFYIAWLKEVKEKWKSAWQAALAGSRDVVSALDSLFGQFAENQATRLDNEEKQRTDGIERWYEHRRAAIEATVMDEEAKVAALEALDEEKARKENKLQHDMDKERRKLARKEAKAKKVSALFSAGINVAEAITKAFTAGPLIGQILAGIVAALGAIQMAAIAAAPLPALAKGGKIGVAGIVGEEGPELFFPRTPGTIVPLRTETTALPTQATITMTFLGPLISTTGLARADLERAGNALFDIIEMQARRRGYALNGS